MNSRTIVASAFLLLAACGDEDPVSVSEDGDPANEERPDETPGRTDAGVDGGTDPDPELPEIAKVRVTPTSGLSTSETGQTASFTVELTARPTAEVTIRLFSSAEQEGRPDVAQLRFTPDSWQRQTVVVTGVDDPLPDGSVRYQIVLDEAVSDDLRYQSVPVSDVTLVNVDDDVPGFTFLHGEGPTTNEYGESASLQVRLNTRPTAAVALTVVSDDPGEGTVQTAPLTFLPRNWDVPQDLLVTGVNDDEGDGDQPYHVSVASVTSDDLDYRDLTGESIELTNLDNDTPGIVFDPIYENRVQEDYAGYLSFRFASRPTSAVRMTCRSSDPAQLRVYPESLYVYASDWASYHQFNLQPGDEYDDGDHEVVVTCDASESSDPAYDGLQFEPLTLRVIDNDVSDVRATASSQRTCETSADFCCSTLTVSLGATPTSGSVVVSVTSSDPSEGRPAQDTVTVSSQRWSNTVKVCGVDDTENDGDVPYTVTLAVQSSEDPAFLLATPVVLTLTNIDHD